MKTTLIIMASLGIIAGAALLLTQAGRHAQPTPAIETAGTSEPEMPIVGAGGEKPGPAEKPAKAQQKMEHENETSAAKPKPVQPAVFEQALSTLISPQSTYEQKQAAWGQLRSAGKLDQVITELEQRIAASGTVPEYHASLGQACLQKAGTIQDIREQGILGMKADQSFEAALNLDPQNWEARFWKATAMSYWPPQLGKGKEVIEQYLELVKQQEVRPPEPQYAQTYVLLGDEYKKQGHPEYAAEIWKRGLGLFPRHEALMKKASGQE